jgi:hypothetical protein
MDDMKFFVWLNDQQAGPFDDTTIRKMLLQKQISHDTLICPESGDLDFPVSKIQFLEYPIPGFWKAFSVATVREETQVVKSLQLTKNEVRTVKKSTYFVHNGDEFISVRAEDDSTCSIRWSAVERHFYSKSM